MRAFVVTGPRRAGVEDVEAPAVRPGEVVVDVALVGVCGTDVEFYTGAMVYLRQGHAAYPMRLGHEWCGTVSATGDGVDPQSLGRRVTGDTMLGCGDCHRCRNGRQYVCDDRFEIGVRHGWPGALAEQLPVPVNALHPLPDTVDDTMGALAEPGGNALRAVEAAAVGPGSTLLVYGPGTIGLLAAQFALAQGAEVHVVGRSPVTLELARDLGVQRVWALEDVPTRPYDAVIDATNAAAVPSAALELVEPGGRVVYIGLAGEPSTVDARTLVLKDVTAVGVLSGSPALRDAIGYYSAGRVDPRPIVAATVSLDRVGAVLDGWRPSDAGVGPKIHVDPWL